ncbi:hypothetical protein LV89_04721 [Arcicella aurantiaca]|uniref:HNH endonuclease n=1 Tax=Arcicella aurantiaca TaxID=591202 RepID=A0A316DHY8_9BACT|nr:hypothetical protein [Arcicella aurantiaca]PWK16839.1 hypothetical protein LV89_04721 [Arcicella aurantiaca]
MGIQLRTHKMLWGRSGNICAFPGCKKELVMDISETDDISVVGEEAHIVAREKDGPRGISPLTPEQRDKYDNLILMCSVHHKVIDDYPDRFPIKLLLDTKRNHENWVKQNLIFDNTKQREDEVYASYIDEFLKLADIENYKAWTSWLLSSDNPKILKEQYNKLRELINYIISRVWYKRYPELENALFNLKNVLNDLLNVFDKYVEDVRNSEQICTNKFYKIDRWDDELYNHLLGKYMYHIELIYDLTLELTRATNYLFDKVRQQLVPSFRIKEGVLLIEVGPFMDMSWRTYRVEYRHEEILVFPYPGLRKFMEIRDNRDINWGTGVSEDYLPLKFD